MNLNPHAMDGPPCRHMRHMLDQAADGRERGFFSRYARSHAKGCGRCGRYLRSLEGMVTRLHGARAEDDVEALERLMGSLDL
jgi:hypothetical protein